MEKYRPQTLDEYIFHDPFQQEKILEFIQDQNIPHLILSGLQGSGKTTLAQLLIQYLNVEDIDVMTLNASNDRGIETFRDKVLGFASTTALGNFKILHLEEGDRLTLQAQDALKVFMEERSDDVKIIITCNNVQQLTGPFRSRCSEFVLTPSSKETVVEYLLGILTAENVKFDLQTVCENVDQFYPDVRKIVNSSQQYTTAGVLHTAKTCSTSGSDRLIILSELIKTDSWADIRSTLCSSVQPSEWDHIYRYLYENIHSSPTFGSDVAAWERAIILIADYLYRNTIVADPAINAAALFIMLKQCCNKPQ